MDKLLFGHFFQDWRTTQSLCWSHGQKYVTITFIIILTIYTYLYFFVRIILLIFKILSSMQPQVVHIYIYSRQLKDFQRCVHPKSPTRYKSFGKEPWWSK